jgi:hypothetical protein
MFRWDNFLPSGLVVLLNKLSDFLVLGFPTRSPDFELIFSFQTSANFLLDLVSRSVLKEFGPREYIVYSRKAPGAEEYRITYEQAGKQVAALANALKEKYGLKKGDHVAMAMRNYPWESHRTLDDGLSRF